jgi:hypothetical protein
MHVIVTAHAVHHNKYPVHGWTVAALSGPLLIQRAFTVTPLETQISASFLQPLTCSERIPPAGPTGNTETIEAETRQRVRSASG